MAPTESGHPSALSFVGEAIATSIGASGMERFTTFNPPSAEKAIATVIVNQFDPSGLNFRPASRWKGNRNHKQRERIHFTLFFRPASR